MSLIEMRLAALETQLVELKAENELLKALPSLTQKKVKANAKDVKKNTNPTGPAEFNAFINAVWHEMAATAGVIGDHNDAFKKASKDVGVTFVKARTEASRRKAEMEGRSAPVPKTPTTKVSVKKAKAIEPSSSTVVEVASQEVVEVASQNGAIPSEADIIAVTPDCNDSERLKIKTEGESYGWEARLFNNVACWLEAPSGNVYSYTDAIMIGIYDPEEGEFLATA
jgi:hypothetical protein